MPSSYTTNLRLTLPATGENNGTCGSLVNTGITALVDSAIAGTANVTMTNADYTLTNSNGAADEARCMFINLSGTISATRNVICPNTSKLYFVYNGTTGGKSIVFKTLAGNGITIPNGKRATLYCDGTNVVFAFDQVSLTPTVTISGAIDGASTDYGINLSGVTIKSNVTWLAAMYRSNPSTEAASFTLATLQGYRAAQGVIGAGSTVTDQHGFFANSDLIGAQNNYGFYSTIPTQTPLAVSAINGNGTTVTVDTAVNHGFTTGDSILISQVPETSMTSGSYNGGPYVITVVDADTFTFSSTATSSAPVVSGNVTRANRWNFYAAGTGQNYFGGPVILSANSHLDGLRISQSGSGNALVVEDVANPDNTPYIIDTNGRTILGYTSSLNSVAGIAAYSQQHGNTINTSAVAVTNWSATDTNEAGLYLAKSGSGTVGIHTAVVNNENIGRVIFSGSNGTNFLEAAKISAVINGAPGTTSMPGKLVFSTTPVGGTSAVDRLTIAANGGVDIPGDVTAGNITAGNLTSGTWSPTISSTVNVASSSSGTCYYQRVGSVVTFGGAITIQATATGLVQLQLSLPVASNFSTTNQAAGTALSSVAADMVGVINSNAFNDTLAVEYTATTTNSRTFLINGIYRII